MMGSNKMTLSLLIFFLMLLIVIVPSLSYDREEDICLEQDRLNHPVLCGMIDRLVENPSSMSQELHDWAQDHGLLVHVHRKTSLRDGRRLKSSMPVVFAHGMGDSCFNDGMHSLVERTSSVLSGTYSVCVPTGDNLADDTNSGYFLNMDASVERFAEKIRKDPKLKNGFHAVGISQGNNVIRGYIAKHNDPIVNTFISINGVNAGEGAVPHCRPKSVLSFPSVCDLLMEQASRAAYTTYAQAHSFQANYWRDPRPSEFPTYQKFAQLAQWNNEGLIFNETLKENWEKTSKFVWIMATHDQMVWPKEGEHWGAPDPKNPFQHILSRHETEWYKKDLFGLRTAEEQGKNFYESFEGDHLQFSDKEYDGWILKYLS